MDDDDGGGVVFHAGLVKHVGILRVTNQQTWGFHGEKCWDLRVTNQQRWSYKQLG